ncbi:recombinase family protein [Salmonella enterica]|nr:recombinase family protein [Salmonella enterica]
MTTSRVYAYLRASTKEQDAERARAALAKFATDNNIAISAEFIENVSGASMDRPELMKLIEIAQSGDVLLLEQVDRLSRLKADDWENLKGMINSKGIRVVALDLPTSWIQLQQGEQDFMASMMKAINGMMLDMLAAISRKDYEDRKRRAAEGIENAKAAGKYQGRPSNEKLHAQIREWRKAGKSYSEIQTLTGAARTTISKVLKG